MNKTHLASDGTVLNTIALPDNWTGKPGEWPLPKGHTLIDRADCRSGDRWDGTKFIKRTPTAEEKEAAYRQDITTAVGSDEIGTIFQIVAVIADQQKQVTPDASKTLEWKSLMLKLDAIRARHGR